MERNVKDIKISVVIPILNTVTYIRECLESVKKQSIDELEIICVDGGSVDGTLEIIKEYLDKDKRFKLIDDTKGSYGAQANRGIREACGQYIAIVEPDDYIDEKMYEKLYAEAIRTGADIVRCNYSRFIDTEEGRLFFFKSACKENQYYVDKNAENDKDLFECTPANWSGIYNRRYLIDNNIVHNTTKGAAYQDLGFWFLSFALASKIRYINESGYYYRVDNPGSSINSVDREKKLSLELSWLQDQLKQRNIYDAFENRFRRVETIHRGWARREITDGQRNSVVARMKDDVDTGYIMFGMGADGVDFITYVRECGCLDRIKVIVDNDKILWGSKVFGIEICSPEIIRRYDEVNIIVTSSRFFVEIRNQLMSMGISENYIFKLEAKSIL